MPIHAFDVEADPLETIDLLPGGLGDVTTLIEVLRARAQGAPLPDELPEGPVAKLRIKAGATHSGRCRGSR